MRCSKCGDLEDKVIDSRSSKDGCAIRRRRECLNCGHRYTTYEQIERNDLRVVKRDDARQPFDREKLLGSFIKACEKRPVSIDLLEQATDDVINDLQSENLREIPTNLIGAKVMKKLETIDPIAYVRYASVYRRFQDVGEFLDEIESLERRPLIDAAHQDLFGKP